MLQQKKRQEPIRFLSFDYSDNSFFHVGGAVTSSVPFRTDEPEGFPAVATAAACLFLSNAWV
jgi:hypothetical protein